MLADAHFSTQLNHYVEQVSAQELPLLQHLRTETRTQTNMINMLSGPVEGKLLELLVSLSGAKLALEIGTFTGYSALNIAAGLPNDGKLITLELSEQYARIAQRYFDRSPHGHKIECRIGKALDSIQSINEQIDFVFIDADKQNYPLYYDMVMPKLRSGGFIVVDNALWGGEVIDPKDPQSEAIDQLNRKAKADPNVETLMLTVRDGILVIRKQ